MNIYVISVNTTQCQCFTRNIQKYFLLPIPCEILQLTHEVILRTVADVGISSEVLS